MEYAARKKESVHAKKPALTLAVDRKDIAKGAEEACHMPGNINGPDLDYFEEKYQISGFA